MLPKEKRIPREQFKELLLSRKFSNSPHFSLRIGVATMPRFAVAVSKKVSKSAVVRNRIRRRVYNVISSSIDLFSPGLYLFIAKSGADKLKVEHIKTELDKLIKKG